MPEQLGYQFDRVYAQPIERYRQLATIAERDAIPTGKRWEGMLCYVTSEGKDYQLSGGLTNSDWVVTVNNPSDYMVKIGDYWVDKGANTDTANLEVGDYFQGWIESDTRYVIGKVLALPFDVDDVAKVALIVDSDASTDVFTNVENQFTESQKITKTYAVAPDLTLGTLEESLLPTIFVENLNADNDVSSAQVVLKAPTSDARLILTRVTSTRCRFRLVMRGYTVFDFYSDGAGSQINGANIIGGGENTFSDTQRILAVQDAVLNTATGSQESSGSMIIKHNSTSGNRWTQVELIPDTFGSGIRLIGEGVTSTHRKFHIVINGELFVTMTKNGSAYAIDFKGKPLTGLDNLDLSGLGSYADDTAAATGGVAVGYAYVNSSTGAVHRRLT